MRSCVSCFIMMLAGAVAGLPATVSAAPRIWKVTPRIITRGTTAEVTVERWHHEARELLFYGPGVQCTSTTFHPDKHQLTCTLQIAADCRLGEQPFRIRTDEGLSDLGTIHVGPYPIVHEGENWGHLNDTPAQAKPISGNTTVFGTLLNSPGDDIDCYRVSGRAGDRLSVEVEMVRIADYPENDPQLDQYDAQVAILDPSGRTIAHNDDSSLHRQDPVLSLLLPMDGDYIVAVRRSMFFRLITPYAVHIGSHARPLAAYPAGGPLGEQVPMEFIGDPLGPITQTVMVPEQPGTFGWFGDAPSPLLLRACPFPNQLEDRGGPVTTVHQLPVALNGILAQPGETDCFRLSVKKGERLQVRVWSAAIGLPVDPVIRLRPLDATGMAGDVELEADDAKHADRDIFGGTGDFPDSFDPSVIWVPMLDGDYLLEISDIRGFGGPTHVYRVEIAPPADSLHIVLESTAFYRIERPRATSLAVPRGSRWAVNLSLFPGQGTTFRGPFELAVEGLPAGMRAIAPTVPAGRTSWPLLLEADADAAPAAALIRVTATPVAGERPLTVVNQQNIPRVNYSGFAWRSIRLDQFATAIVEPAPLSVEIPPPRFPLPQGAELSIPVSIVRRPGFDEPLEMQCMFGPPGVVLPPAVEIPSGQTIAPLVLAATSKAQVGSGPLSVMVSTKRSRLGADNYRGTEQIRVSSPLVNLAVAGPFVAMASDPQSVRRGEHLAYRWAINQQRPFPGRATVRLVGLPSGVSMVGPAPSIDATTTELAFDLEATDDALVGMVNGLSCELTFLIEGTEIRMRSGIGKLRIDPRQG